MEVKKIIKITRFILIFVALGIIFWLFYRDFAPNGKLEAVNNFKNKSPLLSGLYPAERMRGIENNGLYSQTIMVEPVYFDLTIPRFFKTAKIAVRYQNPSQNLFQIGVKNAESDWDFLFQTLEDKEKGIAPKEFNGFKIAEAKFELHPWFIKNRKINFMLSSPLLYYKGEEIKIYEIKIILEREPWTISNFLPRFKKYLKLSND